MKAFLDGEESLASLLARHGVALDEVPSDAIADMALRDMSHTFLWAWCRAGAWFGQSKRLTPLLCGLLLRDDHEGHEDLADTLQDLRDPASIDCLYECAISPLAYLDYNDGASLARRCVWALHDIGTPEAMKKLAFLQSDAREDVSSEAAKRLEAITMRGMQPVDDYRLTRDKRLGPK